MSIPELYQLYLQHSSVQTDTRRLKSGDLFFALKGPNFNGNAFTQQALDRGAAFAVIDEAAYAIEGRTVLVPDVLTALQELARHHRRQFNIPFIAVTGSNGKTTTKELIHAALSARYRTYTTEGNLNNHIGVPLTLLKIRPDAEMAIIEMGANHQKEIEGYCRIAEPTHGVITNCGKAHLEGFGGVEGVRKGKGELYDHLRAQGGTAFVFRDYDYLREMSRGIPHIITYGTADAEVTGVAETKGSFLEVDFTSGFTGRIPTQLVGTYNLPNILAAVTIGRHFGVEEEAIRSAISSYAPSNSRSQLMQRGSNQIILDAYNANPSSMKAAVENFARIDHPKKILVLGAMAELGAESVEEHAALARIIGQYPWDHVLLVGGDFLKTEHPFVSLQTAEEAGAWLQGQDICDAYLLVKGSRSMGMEKVLPYLHG